MSKVRRRNNSLVKSHRLISLTFFLLKLMEKLADEEIKSTVLVQKPLHPNQHAYRAGSSRAIGHGSRNAFENWLVVLCATI